MAQAEKLWLAIEGPILTKIRMLLLKNHRYGSLTV
jgi:hypothetical protein